MKNKKMTWKDITLQQMLLLQNTEKIEDKEEQLFSMAEIILGKDVLNLPLPKFLELVKSDLAFLSEPIELDDTIPPKKLEVNGRKYYTDCLLGNITTAQYIDFTNHGKAEDIVKMLSVFIIPEGHSYNDGYDMEQVFRDINDLPFYVANSISSFFRRQFELSMKAIQRCSTNALKKTKTLTEEQKKLINLVENSVDLVLSPLS